MTPSVAAPGETNPSDAIAGTIEDIQSDLDYTSFMMIPSLLTLR